MKLGILNSHPIQYFAPLYQRLAKSPSIQLKVYYCSTFGVQTSLDPQFGKEIKWDIPLTEGYHYVFLKNRAIKKGPGKGALGIINPGIIKALFKDKPDALIVHGWAYFTYLLAILYCLFSKTKLILRTESPYNQEMKNTSIIARIKRWILQKIIFPRTYAFLYIGEQNRLFYKSLKVPDHKLFFAPYSIDNNRFRNDYQRLKSQKPAIRQSFGIPDDAVVFLFSGKFIPKKRPIDLIEAYAKISNKNSFIIFMGDGELRSQMGKKIESLNLKNRVLITGFKNQTQIADYFVASDVFVLPSTIGETWGLVTNEAMNFNLPVILSNVPGSAYDLVEETKNGFIYNCGDINELADKMNWFLNNKDQIPIMGDYSSRIIEKYSYDEYEKAITKLSENI